MQEPRAGAPPAQPARATQGERAPRSPRAPQGPRATRSSGTSRLPPEPVAGIVEAKLAAPRLAAGVLPRDRRVEALRHIRDERVVALVAPAGYGKSTILGLWRSRESRPVAWVTIDAADADPIRLLAHLAVAVDRAVGLRPSAEELLRGARDSAIDRVIPRLVASLGRDTRPLVLMLDDVHAIAGTDAADALAMLIDYLPAHVTVALAGRTDAGLPLARHRARGNLVELTARELALGEDESAELVRRQGRRLAPAEAALLQERTEGWPVAVYLASRRAARMGTAVNAPVAIAGRDHEMAEYLDAELLAGVPPAVRQLLLRSSILERLNGDLCDAVAGRRGSAAILRALAATNLLVVRLDAPGGWYRCHILLREHLLARLDETPAERRALHGRAAAWYAAHGMPEDAIEQSVSAGDLETAAATLTGVALGTYRAGRAATFSRLIDHLDEATLLRHPFLPAMGMWAAALAGRVAEAERMARLADAGAYDSDRPAGAGSLEPMSASGRAMMARHGIAAAMADAEWAVAHVPPEDAWRPACLAILGSIHAVAGDATRAEAVLRETSELAADTPANRAYVTAQAWRAVLAIGRDDWNAAAHLMADVDAAAARYGHEPDATSAVAAAVAARVAMSRGDGREAARRLADFQVGRVTLGAATPWLSVGALAVAAAACLAVGDPSGARSVLQQAEDVLARRPDLGPLPDQVAALRAQIRGLPPGLGGASTLTPAELRVLRLLPTYLSAPEIAERLRVAPNTVKTQIQAVYGKLGASSRAEAVERAIEAGLLEPLPALATSRVTRS